MSSHNRGPQTVGILRNKQRLMSIRLVSLGFTNQDRKSVGSLERVICFPKIGDCPLAKIGAGGKPLVGDSLRTFGPHEKFLSIFDSY